MRKLLFLSFALVCALSGNAQKVVLKDGRITKQQIVDLPNQKMERSADVKRVGPNRTQRVLAISTPWLRFLHLSMSPLPTR